MKTVERQLRNHELEVRFEENGRGQPWWIHYFVDGISVPREDFAVIVAMLNAEAAK